MTTRCNKNNTMKFYLSIFKGYVYREFNEVLSSFRRLIFVRLYVFGDLKYIFCSHTIYYKTTLI